MSNLSKETHQQIADSAYEKGMHLKVDENYKQGYISGFIDGATEWAGRGQGLVDALKETKKKLNILDNSDAIEIINAALAKYKEVSNG
jgi:hypothetical protein